MAAAPEAIRWPPPESLPRRLSGEVPPSRRSHAEEHAVKPPALPWWRYHTAPSSCIVVTVHPDGRASACVTYTGSQRGQRHCTAALIAPLRIGDEAAPAVRKNPLHPHSI